jgi:hypothetical protein
MTYKMKQHDETIYPGETARNLFPLQFLFPDRQIRHNIEQYVYTDPTVWGVPGI